LDILIFIALVFNNIFETVQYLKNLSNLY
jgi:hypothetical protein